MSDYGIRAATALHLLLPSHRSKVIERLFDVSPRTAKYLLAGKYWTIERLSQAGRLIQGFDQLIATPNLHQRLDALETEIAELREHFRGEGDGR